MTSDSQLSAFLLPYSESIRQLTFDLCDFVSTLIPESNQLIWDNYNAVAIAYSKSEVLKDAFCHIAVYSKHVNFGFNRGAELKSQQLQLSGKGKLIRHFSVTDYNAFPKKDIEILLREALLISGESNPDIKGKTSMGKTIVKSISKNKLRPKV